uniref:Uncharacterized protein n=1 Tax=Graphocephala atropunctata TaxID=36148 RepID=A0A1B6LXS3_9HEMI
MQDSAVRKCCRKFALYDNLETKKPSKQRMHSLSKPKTSKQTLTMRNTMASYWDGKVSFSVDFMGQETAITKETYCKTLRCLWRAIQNNQKVVVLIHDINGHSAK